MFRSVQILFIFYPGIPKTPKASDTGISPKSGRIVGGALAGPLYSLVSPFETVCVFQSNLPTIYFPTGKLLFLLSITL